MIPIMSAWHTCRQRDRGGRLDARGDDRAWHAGRARTAEDMDRACVRGFTTGALLATAAILVGVPFT